MSLFPNFTSDDTRSAFAQVFAWAVPSETRETLQVSGGISEEATTYPSPIRAGFKRPEECVDGQKIRDDLIASLLGDVQNSPEEKADLSNKVILGLLNQLGKTSELLTSSRKQTEAAEKENQLVRAELAETMRLLRLSEEECIVAKKRLSSLEEDLQLRKAVLDKIHTATEKYHGVSQKP